MFDKKLYAKRRAAGLRGQPGPRNSKRGYIIGRGVGLPWSSIGNKPVSSKAIRKNTKRARRMQV